MDATSKAEWERVSLREDDVVTDLLERIAVPGGWLYRSHIGGNSRATCAMCFVPDQAEAMQRLEEVTCKLREEWKEVLDDI